MNYYEVQNRAIDEITKHKKVVERVAETNLVEALKLDSISNIYHLIKDKKRELAENIDDLKSIQKIDKEIINARKKLRAEFKKHHIKLSSIVPKYWCNKCKDSGYLKGDVCECVKTRTTSLLMSVDGIRPVETTFENTKFDVFSDKEYMVKVYSKAKSFIDKMETTKYNNFTILGGVGVGKTHLMECMANHALTQNRYVIYMSAFRLNQLFLNYHTCPVSEKNSVIEPILQCDFLMIDDLGCEQLLNNVTIPMLTMLINERNISNKKTIITTNLTLDDIRERYDYRLCSRLLDKNVSISIEIKGKDLRQK